jgi:hypothetical protein
MKRMTNEEFIKRAKNKHGNKYDYSLVEYKGYDIKVKIICPIHGIFEQTPRCHIKSECIKCFTSKRIIGIDNFIKKAKKIHNNKYDYSLSNYINRSTPIKIICEEHGIFEQLPYAHLRGSICYKCFAKNKCTDTEDFIKRAKKIHGDKYDYSFVKYENVTKKVKIICQKHGIFLQSPSSHLRGFGCQICKSSKGEEKISKILKKKNIIFEREKRFAECRNIIPLPFDFFLPNHNMCIEFDGEQHFVNKPEWNNTLLEIKKRDEIKNIYCQENNIILHRFNYKEFNIIEDKLNEIFK